MQGNAIEKQEAEISGTTIFVDFNIDTMNCRCFKDGLFENSLQKITHLHELSTSPRTKLKRPFVAEDKCTDKDGNKEVSPRTPDSLSLTSSNADNVSILVDAFDTSRDKVIYEFEKSPRNKSRRFKTLSATRREHTSLPQVMFPKKPKSLSILSSYIQMISTPLPVQL